MLSNRCMEREQREASRSPLNTSCPLWSSLVFSLSLSLSSVFCIVLVLLLYRSISLLFIKRTYSSRPMLCYSANDNLTDWCNRGCCKRCLPCIKACHTYTWVKPKREKGTKVAGYTDRGQHTAYTAFYDLKFEYMSKIHHFDLVIL